MPASAMNMASFEQKGQPRFMYSVRVNASEEDMEILKVGWKEGGQTRKYFMQ